MNLRDNQSITVALEDFNNIHHAKNKNETAYDVTLSNAAYRFGNVHDEEYKIYLYVKCLLQALTTIFQRLRNAKPRKDRSMECTFHLARENGYSYHSRLHATTPGQEAATRTVRTIPVRTVVRPTTRSAVLLTRNRYNSRETRESNRLATPFSVLVVIIDVLAGHGNENAKGGGDFVNMKL